MWNYAKVYSHCYCRCGIHSSRLELKLCTLQTLHVSECSCACAYVLNVHVVIEGQISALSLFCAGS